MNDPDPNEPGISARERWARLKLAARLAADDRHIEADEDRAERAQQRIDAWEVEARAKRELAIGDEENPPDADE